jgi:hypothetical protein
MSIEDQLSNYLARELSDEWQRKASVENRAFALISASLAIAALFFAAGDQLDLFPQLAASPSPGLLIIALVAVSASVLSALLAALPLSYRAPKTKAIDELIRDLPHLSSSEVAAELLQTQLEQLKSARRSNGAKAILIYLSYVSIGCAAVALLSALLYSL